MSINPLCATCRQVFRLHFGQIGRSQDFSGALTTPAARNVPRLFSTSRLLSASPATPRKPQVTPKRESQATPRASQPKPAPVNAEDPEAVPSEGNKDFRAPSADTPTRTIAKELTKALPAVAETYRAYGVCERLVKECARQADYTIPQAHEKNVEIPKTKDNEDLGVGTGWWFESLGLTPTFNTWAQITFLHMYLLTCRLRCFPPASATVWHQHLLDHFFYVAEDRMVATHNVAARSIRNKYLKDLFVQWRGLQAGYDEGIVRGDAVLATAVWRNVFKADQDVDFRGVGEVVSYIRGVLKGLDEMPDESVTSGEIFFGDPASERDVVLSRSRLMTDSVPAEPAKAAGHV